MSERDIIWLPRGKLTAKQIIEAVAERYELTAQDLTGPVRTVQICLARDEACWEIRLRTKLSLPNIGRRMGGRHHATILMAVRRHAARLEQAQEMAA